MFTFYTEMGLFQTHYRASLISTSFAVCASQKATWFLWLELKEKNRSQGVSHKSLICMVGFSFLKFFDMLILLNFISWLICFSASFCTPSIYGLFHLFLSFKGFLLVRTVCIFYCPYIRIFLLYI